ncbi:MAG: glycerophosphoryl diester phosphodiesterase [Piscirickettsiaceae bacterium]|nr:MAG: glycerophosphoryl diester phosphodiesterase [Piscirickettsiaceae bacterium]PCI68809.1 MAG: glycerophosphoryl diester phosphodiesterase [Piscirickettsiaceae bacterium]
MLSFGHRGAMGYAPENTLLSIRKAIDLGADWVEVDVYLVDQQLLVIHDETLERTTNGRGRLSKYTFAELRELDAGQGERIPTLQEVIDMTKGKVGLNVELKGKGTAIAVIKCLASLDVKHKDSILISSFKINELEQIAQADSTIKIGVLADRNADAAFSWASTLQAYSIHLSKRMVSQALVKRAREAGLQLYVYTVNSGANIRRMRKMGVDGVFSDYPDRVLDGKPGQFFKL